MILESATMTGPNLVSESRTTPTHPSHPPAHDQYGRRIDYLRVSLTDRCNMRCVYCMPAGGLPLLPRPELLSNDELLLVLRAAAAAGFRKIRLTGGEPTLRHEIVELVRAIKAIPGIEHVQQSLLVSILASTSSASVRKLSLSRRTGYARKLHLRTIYFRHGSDPLYSLSVIHDP
jgi:uncharacterized radical SAM superfamily Fe-S cluster-containing enzyme